MKKLILAVIGACCLAASAQAQMSVSVSVTAPWVRATVPAQKSAGVYMQVQSATPARLVGVSTPVAANAELHKMEMKDHVMKMGKVDAIELPAGKAVNLASGNYHIMLTGLKQQLKEGQVLELTLQVQGKDNKRENVTIKVPVKPITFISPQATQHAAH